MVTSWKEFLDQERAKPYYGRLDKLISANVNLTPRPKDIFAALRLTPLDNVRVVMLGQNPYPKTGDANGLAYSCSKTNYIPPTLKVIFRELMSSTGVARYNSDLSDWSQQGVLLLNRILTTEVEKTNAHEGIGWEVFTAGLVELLATTKVGLVFVLWGNTAQAVEYLIPTDRNHLVLKAPHPAMEAHKPGSGFYGCKHFLHINRHLAKIGSEPIAWS